jgi:hypothetical protein
MSETFASARSDSRQAAVERALRAAAQRLLAREIGIGEALAAVGVVLAGPEEKTATPREIAAAGKADYRAQIVGEILRLERDGRGRDAADIVARDQAMDRRDPIEVETLKNKFRRWRRAAEKRAGARP